LIRKIYLIFSVLFFNCVLFSQSSNISAEGFGMTEDAAIEQAKRAAVEIGIGTVMSSETVVKNSVLFSDNIFAKSTGFVKTFTVTDKFQGPDGLWTITIDAVVTEIIDEILQDELAVQTLLNAMNRPKIIFMIKEQNLIDNTPTDFAETQLIKMFYDKGFDVVDRQLVQALKGESDYTQALSGDVSAASKIASMLGADIIVIGTAKISSGGVIGAGNFQMTSGQADINGKIVRADTGELLAIVPQARGKKPHISPSTAGINAANEASSILGSDIIGQLIKKWSTQQSNAVNVFLVVENVNFSSYMALGNHLKSQMIPGIQSAFEKGFNDGVAEFQILYEGKSQDLAMALMQNQSADASIEVTGLSGNRISAQISQ
tara:strand:- start:512 stop:1636 length:1125 start_codon:yes stop_codon:yes gene_type:complete